MKNHCIHDKEAVFGRGLCRRCYNYAANMVRKGAWTWAQLEESGKAKGKGKPGRRAPAWADSVVGYRP